MNSAKEKAIELTDKMFNTQNSPCTWKGAKKCAIIAVDEILPWNQTKFWEDVKQEIEKL